MTGLQALPYASWVEVDDDARNGVVVHDPERAEPGLNLVHLRYLNRATLTDMEGETLHRWSAPVAPGDGWHHVEPTPDGGLVAVHKMGGLTRLDADSNVLWRRDDLEAHHDVALTPDGGLWAVAREFVWIDRPARRAPDLGPAPPLPRQLPMVDDLLVRLDATGRSRETISMYELLGDAVPEHQWRRLREWTHLRQIQGQSRQRIERWARRGDASEPFHLNSVELVTEPVPGVAAPGDLVICLRNLDLVAVVDPASRKVRWRWGPGELERPHHPGFLPDGHLLLFDNGTVRGWSRVLELEPQSGEIVWRYRAEPRGRFFSAKRGSVQRLPGGNTLIAESDRGRVFEVTPEGEVVWELLTPIDRSTEPPRRSTIYRLARLPRHSHAARQTPATTVSY